MRFNFKMMKKQKGFNQRKFIMEIKEFKKKKNIHKIICKMHEKQKEIHKEYNNIFDLRADKLRHNALTNNHLQHYIADLILDYIPFLKKINLLKENN